METTEARTKMTYPKHHSKGEPILDILKYSTTQSIIIDYENTILFSFSLHKNQNCPEAKRRTRNGQAGFQVWPINKYQSLKWEQSFLCGSIIEQRLQSAIQNRKLLHKLSIKSMYFNMIFLKKSLNASWKITVVVFLYI